MSVTEYDASLIRTEYVAQYDIGGAMEIVKEGGQVRRLTWPEDVCLGLDGEMLLVYAGGAWMHWRPRNEDLLAEDWERFDGQFTTASGATKGEDATD
jgi:hypothetical protein